MQTETKNYEIRRGRTEIDILDQGLTFVHPNFGPRTYANVGTSIEQAGLARPTMAETASLAYEAFCANGNEAELGDVKSLMKNKYLWGFTGILYVPNEGAFIQDDPEIRDRMPFMDKDDLIGKLESNDPSVRHVPFGFKTEYMSALELGKNPFVVGLAGEDGADKLAQIADKHKGKPYLWGFKFIDQPITRVSALDSGWGLVGRLVVDGDGRGYWSGCAFGVLRTGEASREEN